MILLVLLISSLGYAESIEVPTVVIEEAVSARAPLDPYSVFKTERVSEAKKNAPQRQTLADLLKDQVGVEAQTYCANCGAKRLTINGLKGEHTSLLVDGLPLHSAVSSFYGMDNVPVLGIADVLVMRGAGASLTNPEAIGGTLNILTVDPLSVENKYSTSVGWDDQWTGKFQNHSLLYSFRNSERKFAVTLGGQVSKTMPWDSDQNGVTESPQRENSNALVKARWLINQDNDVNLRYSHSQLGILGGALPLSRPSQVRPIAAQELDFEDGNVHKQYIGDRGRITDWIDLKRDELALTSTHFLSERLTLESRWGVARQEQKSIYQHGFDYSNIDIVAVGDQSLQIALSDEQVITLGLFFKDQRLRSASQTLFVERDLPRDSFNAYSYAVYGRYSLVLAEQLELDLALRMDRVGIHWLDLDNKIDDVVAAPRLQLLHEMTEHFSQRFSYGLGYRTPLTFFESQHGNNERGYQMAITDLEKAHSLVYSLSYNTPDYYLTGGTHYTNLQSMAYGLESPLEPTSYQNSIENYEIWVHDFLVGYKPTAAWLLEASLEFFKYPDGYARRLPTAAIERRVQLSSTYEKKKWKHWLNIQIIGSRDLSRYANYPNHFVVRNQAMEPVLDTTMQRARQKAPTFWTLDSSLSYKFSKLFILSGGVTNLFNVTQASLSDSPSTWHWHFTHAHFDGLHTWGPNIGRQYFLQLSGSF